MKNDKKNYSIFKGSMSTHRALSRAKHSLPPSSTQSSYGDVYKKLLYCKVSTQSKTRNFYACLPTWTLSLLHTTHTKRYDGARRANVWKFNEGISEQLAILSRDFSTELKIIFKLVRDETHNKFSFCVFFEFFRSADTKKKFKCLIDKVHLQFSTL